MDKAQFLERVTDMGNRNREARNVLTSPIDILYAVLAVWFGWTAEHPQEVSVEEIIDAWNAA